MSEIRALIETLIETGVDPITAAEVISRAAIEGAKNFQPAQQKSPGAIRQARYVERHKASRNDGKRHEMTGNDTNDVCDKNHKEKNPHTPKKETEFTPPSKPPKGGISPPPPSKQTTPRQILETILSKETAGDVLDHRSRMRKPLTNRAATLLIGELQKCRDGPQVAADVMILAGWQSFKNDWYENRKGGNGNGTTSPTTIDQNGNVIHQSPEPVRLNPNRPGAGLSEGFRQAAADANERRGFGTGSR